MPRHHKSEPDDMLIVSDDSSNPVKRANSASNLTYDGFFELEPLFAEWLHASSHHLRAQAIQSLVGVWKRSDYFENAVKLLRDDTHEEVRSNAAFALSMYTWQSGERRKRVLQELASCLATQENSIVQQKCYEELIRLLAPDSFPGNLPDDFDRDRDVDWELLKPYHDHQTT